MSAPNTGKYYHWNIPKGKRLLEIDAGDWTGAAPTQLLVQPGTSQCYFIKSIVFRIDNAFAMSVGDTITIVADAYDSATYISETIIDTLPITQLIRLGDPSEYQAKVIEGTNYHIVKVPLEPPIYLRSSETPSESLTFTYVDVAGGVTAGSLKIDICGWSEVEADSGLS